MTICTGNIQLKNRPHMVLNRAYLTILEDAGLLDFNSVYTFDGGTRVKQIKERRVDRVEIRHRAGSTVCYLKRHVQARPTLAGLILGWLSGRRPSPGMAEFDNIRDFRNSDIPTVTPVAAGERRTGLFRYESFLMTESVEPYISLEEIIRRHPHRLEGPEGQHRKKRILEAVARLAGKMHEKGFNHCDFNATHVLISPEDGDGRFSLALFDLQRVDRKKWMRLKWFIKIMAELYYTMPAPLFDEKDRVLLFKRYKNINKIGIIDRFQLLWIKLKTRRIERHTEKILARRQRTIAVSNEKR